MPTRRFEAMHRLSREGPAIPLATRREALRALHAWIRDHREDVVAAIDDDFGGRSRYETLFAEVMTTMDAARRAGDLVDAWAKPRRVRLPAQGLPAWAEVRRQPLGVVGVIAPWNYPFHLSLGPTIPAVAAGNRVLVKPSELAPATATLVGRAVAEIFDPDHVDIMHGGAEVGAELAGLPLDHLLFTGSQRVAREVLAAAAANLVPVTLELGGKAPIVVGRGTHPGRAAERIAMGKLFNAGQTCIAPDHVLCHPDDVDNLVDAVRVAMVRLYPRMAGSPDYTAIVSERHLRRLRDLVDDAVARGARAVEVCPEGDDAIAGRRMRPVLLRDVPDDAAVMREEIFGPVLPFVEVDGVDEAVSYINARQRPLALYVVDDDVDRARDVVTRTTSGGAVVNDVLIQAAFDVLPLGGVGHSGMGRYHGEDGFRTFSHERTVVTQRRLNLVALATPPFGAWTERLLSILLR